MFKLTLNQQETQYKDNINTIFTINHHLQEKQRYQIVPHLLPQLHLL
jgi:hypothetical protein